MRISDWSSDVCSSDLAISFACERYAQSLPDIESYIEQKIPVEPITSDLLTALPRKPREGVEANAEEGESIGEIFKEAREQRAADDARRGIKPRSEEHTSELQSLMRISYAVFCLKKQTKQTHNITHHTKKETQVQE